MVQTRLKCVVRCEVNFRGGWFLYCFWLLRKQSFSPIFAYYLEDKSIWWCTFKLLQSPPSNYSHKINWCSLTARRSRIRRRTRRSRKWGWPLWGCRTHSRLIFFSPRLEPTAWWGRSGRGRWLERWGGSCWAGCKSWPWPLFILRGGLTSLLCSSSTNFSCNSMNLRRSCSCSVAPRFWWLLNWPRRWLLPRSATWLRVATFSTGTNFFRRKGQSTRRSIGGGYGPVSSGLFASAVPNYRCFSIWTGPRNFWGFYWKEKERRLGRRANSYILCFLWPRWTRRSIWALGKWQHLLNSFDCFNFFLFSYSHQKYL